MSPVRVQSVKVDRTTKWGNPFIVGQDGSRAECVRLLRLLGGKGLICLTTKATVEAQRAWLDHATANITNLRGKNLACWCGSGPCHADVLLEAANKLTTTQGGP